MKRLYTYILLIACSLGITLNAQTWTELSGEQAGTAFTDSEYIRLSGDVTLTSTIRLASANLTIDLNGYALKADYTKWTNWPFNMIWCNPGYTVTINDSRPTNNNSIGTTAEITGGIITGGSAERGGAIRVEGKLIMNGGTIYNCQAKRTSSDDSNAVHTFTNGCGGGVFVYYGGIFQMNGGAIRNCSTDLLYKKGTSEENTYHVTGCGGGVYVCTDATFTMNAGASISDCNAGSGGGVFVNSAYGDGDEIYDGKVHSANGIFNMNGGQITNNTINGCSNTGGGVFVKGTFNMLGGEISNNRPYDINTEYTRTNYPYHVYTDTYYQVAEDNGYFALAGLYGGGVALMGADAQFNMSGGVIKDNMASSGGGVLLWGGVDSSDDGTYLLGWGGQFADYGKATFKMTGGTIEGNYAVGEAGMGNGGGIYNVNSYVQIVSGNIQNNFARQYGGGINVNDETANLEFSNGSIINISGNQARHGGGISQAQGECKIDNYNMYINNNIAHGKHLIDSNGNEIHDGTGTHTIGSGDGGGIHISSAKLTINGCTINGNRAYATYDNSISKGNGGGLYMVDCDIEIIECNFTNNQASNMGGGVFLKKGGFKVTGEANFTANSAAQGGGFCVYNCNVEIAKGSINQNTASAYGGGAFFYNDGTEYSDLIFSGGTFTKNTATMGGGGVALIGKLNATMNATIENNTAANGGGIYLGSLSQNINDGGATMSFGGIIKRNFAKKIDNTALTTAYLGYANFQDLSKSLQGIGGGIFMGKGTTLSFGEESSSIGLYNNSADNGADDLFANGDGTTVTLPVVKDMNLKDFNGPTSRLYWVEDYVTKDACYENGTWISKKINKSDEIYRYQYALRNSLPTYSLNLETSTEYNSSDGKGYLCLAVGYEMVYLKLTKAGVRNNDDVAFKIYYYSNGEKKHYMDVFFTGKGTDVDVSRTVALPAGFWKFEETDWGWRYDKEKLQFSPAHTTTDFTIGNTTIPSGYLDVSYDKVNKKSKVTNGIEDAEELKITNDVKSTDYEQGKILEHSHRKVNRMKP